MGVHARFALANRREIENEIERLIGLLDAADTPWADLEPELDHAADDVPCDVSAEGLMPILPRYGEDQARGPVNVREGWRAHHRRMMAG